MTANDYLNGLDVDDKLRQSGGVWGTHYFLLDHLGGTAGLAESSGGLAEPLPQFEAFGNGSGSLRTRYGYTGRERDDLTGMLYYRSRWYDPQRGRFESEDPIGFDGGLNLYAYVLNNPIIYNDPLGLQNNKNKTNDPSVNKAGTRCCANLVTDSAGRQCCPEDITSVVLWNMAGAVPHTFLQVKPTRAEGFYPALDWPSLDFRGIPLLKPKGNVLDNSSYLRREDMVPFSYTACPETVKKLNDSMDKNQKGLYDLLNMWPGYNCTSWACARLEDAGITPPMPSRWPGLNPWQLDLYQKLAK